MDGIQLLAQNEGEGRGRMGKENRVEVGKVGRRWIELDGEGEQWEKWRRRFTWEQRQPSYLPWQLGQVRSNLATTFPPSTSIHHRPPPPPPLPRTPLRTTSYGPPANSTQSFQHQRDLPPSPLSTGGWLFRAASPDPSLPDQLTASQHRPLELAGETW